MQLAQLRKRSTKKDLYDMLIKADSLDDDDDDTVPEVSFILYQGISRITIVIPVVKQFIYLFIHRKTAIR